VAELGNRREIGRTIDQLADVLIRGLYKR
jgi:hypothetical protein